MKKFLTLVLVVLIGFTFAGCNDSKSSLAVNIEKFPTHIAGLPVAVNINCHVTRHKTEVI